MPRFPKPQKLAVPVKPPKGHFFFAGHTIERVKWWTSGPMRKLYFLLVVMIMTNTANGFDGSMMNGLQGLTYWQEYFNHPHFFTFCMVYLYSYTCKSYGCHAPAFSDNDSLSWAHEPSVVSDQALNERW